MTSPGISSTVVRPDEVRRHNRTALLNFLHVIGPSTRATLAHEMGLNRSTIKVLVDSLAADGVVEERTSRSRVSAGRPSLLVLPRPEAAVVLAVDVQVEHVSIALIGFGGHIIGRNSWNLHGHRGQPEEVITRIVESTALLAADLGVTPVAGGISVPGVVRRSDGYLHEAPNMRWTDVPLGSRLEKLFRMPVLVSNDAELSALAEYLRGVARGWSDVVYVSADVGVGGGVVAEGSALRGGVGEVGHMIVRPNGRGCHCGSSGCWETEVGEAALCRALGLDEESPRGAVLFELKNLGRDPDMAIQRLAEFSQWLALGLINVVNLLGPHLVVLGDLLAALPQAVVDEVERQVQAESLVSRSIGGTTIVRSILGADVKLLGAGEAVFKLVLDTM